MPESQTLPRFQQVQYRFAAHIRDPERNPAPEGIEDRRLQIYRELFYNNVESFLANAFPVIRKLSTDQVWYARVRDFYSRHQSHGPQFHLLAEEFLKFLQEERGEHPDDPPYLAELAHYEWAELSLMLAEVELTPELADPNGDPLESPPVVSPLAWPLAYGYPVHRISPDFQPDAAPDAPTYLVVYRTRQDEVKFMEINAVTGRLMQLIEENPTVTGRKLLSGIATELQHPDPVQVIEAGRVILASLRERDILLGTRHGA
ncbi:MAG: HvfC family RiPP maturation protein [Panacagrimonas sp.]